MIEGKDETNLNLNSYAGLSEKSPMLALLLSVFMFALAGLPPFAGFFGKYYVFISAVKSNITWLAVIGVISSAISVYFYIRIIVLMYFKESESNFNVQHSSMGILAVFICFIIVILLGIVPGSIINLISSFL
jgi:NADH-quinone oxidoreductase subunit N